LSAYNLATKFIRRNPTVQDILDIIEEALNLSRKGEVMAGDIEDSLVLYAANGEKYVISVTRT
jgi:hypothetical protein